MINEGQAQNFCKDNITKIENYEKALNDTTQTWDLHHRDEIRELPSGMKVYRSRQELKENGRYYQCPANELIFLTHSEHIRLHRIGKHHSAETKHKLSEHYAWRGKDNPFYGKTHSIETRKRMSEHNPWKGKHWKLVDGKRVWYGK